MFDSEEGRKRVQEKGFLPDRIAELMGLARAEILDQLNNGGDQKEQLLVGLRPFLEGEQRPVSVVKERVAGVDVVFVAYSIFHGGIGLPEATSVIEGFRRAAG